MLIEPLISVLPPPANPKEVGNSEDWLRVTARLGIRLPEDYVKFITYYGTGSLSDYVDVLNPFTANRNLNLLRQVPQILGQLRELKEEMPDSFPWPLFFEPGGFLPWGFSIDGDYFGWLTHRFQGTWKIGVMASSGGFEIHDCSFSTFLIGILLGDIDSAAIPVDFAQAPWFSQASTE